MLPPDISGVELSPDEIARFSRPLTLPEGGMGGQKRLKGASVLSARLPGPVPAPRLPGQPPPPKKKIVGPAGRKNIYIFVYRKA